METKVIKRFFGFADFLEEQNFLEQQHLLGWKFLKFEGPIKYVFEKEEPQDYVYRLDFNEDNQDEDSYLQIFKDCGWEYIMKYQTWYYFRKKRMTLNDMDNEIFTDYESKINMIKKVLWKQMMILLPFLLFVPIFAYVYYYVASEVMILKIIWFVYTLAMLFFLSVCVRNVIKLNRLVQDSLPPLDK